MKKIFSFVFLGLIVCTSLCAQQFPDSGFEDWSGATFDGNIQPRYWNFSNVEQLSVKRNFAHQATGRSGNYCLEIKDQFVGVGSLGAISPGYVALGQPWAYVSSLTSISDATAGTYGGLSWTYRPDSIVVWVKRTGPKTGIENFHILYYAWSGTSQGGSYMSKSNGCTDISGSKPAYCVDEESDIRQALDANECGTRTFATQIAEGWYYEMKTYNDWTQIRVPIYYFGNQVPEKCNVILSAGNYPNFRANDGLYDGNTLFVDDISLIYSSRIQKLYIDGREWKGFDPNNTTGEQICSLGEGATSLPTIVAVRGAGQLQNPHGGRAIFDGRQLTAQECVINTTGAAVGGAPVVITVTAEDGSSTSTYRVKFVAKASDNARLSDIQVNGTSIEGFNAFRTTYRVDLPYGTTAVPTVSATAQHSGATVSVAQPTSTDGTATITVTAEDGTTTQTYTLQFGVVALTDVTLQQIYVNGEAIDGYQPTKYNYTVSLPEHTTEVPVVTWQSAYAEGVQTVTILENTLKNGCRLQVSIPNGSSKIYRLTYRIQSSSSPYLKAIVLDGDTMAGFNPAESDYTIVIGDRPQPTIEAVRSSEDQQVLIAGTTILVLSAAGEQFEYHLSFVDRAPVIEPEVDPSLENILLGVMIEGGGYVDLSTYTEPVTVSLPYGSTGLHVTSWEKNYPQQRVLVAEGGPVHDTRITVLSGRAGEAKKEYVLRPEVSAVSPASLSSITVNGAPLPDFSPTRYDYILPVTATPVVIAEAVAADAVLNETEDSKHWQGEVVVGSERRTYTIWYYYTNDVIPNANFSQSATATYNSGFKPASWQVPADGDDSYSWGLQGAVTTGPEVTRNSDGSVHLKTWRSKASNSIYGSIPGMMTLGTLSLELTSTGKSTSSVSGGIAYRNTPDVLEVEVKPISLEKMDNWRVLVSLGGTESLLEGEYSNLGDWRTERLALQHPDVVTTLNITINSAHSDNASDLGGVTVRRSEMDVRRVGFTYSSALTGLQANGAAATLSGTAFSASLTDAESFGAPELVWSKAVLDQAPVITWGEEQDAVRTAQIRNYAEDGTYTDYTLSVTRPLSTNAAYTRLPVSDTLRDARFSVVSPHAALTLDTLQGGYLVVVTPESGSAQRTKVDTTAYVAPRIPSTDATLSDLRIDDTTVPGFSSLTTQYSRSYSYSEWKQPVVQAMPTDMNATCAVALTTDTLQDRTVNYRYAVTVTAEDRVTTRLYSLCLQVEAAPVHELAMLFANGDSIPGFDAEDTDYELQLPFGTVVWPTVTWTAGDAKQQVVQTTTEDAILVTVTAGDGVVTVYTIHISYLPDTNCYLRWIRVKGELLPGFHRDSTTFLMAYPIGTDSTLLAGVADVTYEAESSAAEVSVAQEGSSIVLTVQAASGDIRVYVIEQQIEQSHEARLWMIYLDSTELRDFNPDTLVYEYLLRAGAAIPEVIAEPMDSARGSVEYGRFLPIDEQNPTLGQYIEIDGVAEDGTRITYTLRLLYANWIATSSVDADDYAFFRSSADGPYAYRAVTISIGVQLGIYDMMGHRVAFYDALPTLNPNDVDVTIDENGNQVLLTPYTDEKSDRVLSASDYVVFHAEPGKAYFYVFFNSKTRKVKKGTKFMAF